MASIDFNSPNNSLRQHATRGFLVTGLSQFIKFAVQTGSVVALARLLHPVDYGLVAMVAPIFGFVMMLQDFGLTQATVQKRDITAEQVSTMFWLNLALSCALAIILALCAPLIARFYGEAKVAPLTVAFASLVALNGLGSQHMALLNRQMRFGALALIDTVGAVASLMASLLFAILWDNYWALFVGSLMLSLVPVLGSWLLVRWVPKRPARATGLRSILGFGGGLTGFGFANFFARNLDNVLIGRRWGDSALGIYDRAYKLLLLPLQQVNAPLGRVMLPILSNLSGEPTRYSAAYCNTLRQMLVIVLPGVVFMIATADILVPTILGHEWIAAGNVFGALGYVGLVQPLNNSSGWLFISQARTREFMFWGIFSSITSVIAFIIGLPAGAYGVALAYAVSEIIRTPILWWVVTRSGPVKRADLLRTVAPHAAAVGISLIVAHLARGLLSEPAVPTMALVLVLAYSSYLAVIALFGNGRAAIADTLSLAGSMVKRVRSTASTS